MPEPDPNPTPTDWPSQRQAIEDHLQNDFLMGKIFKDDLRACLAHIDRLEAKKAAPPEAVELLREWGRIIAGSAGMIGARLTVREAADFWYKRVLPFLDAAPAASPAPAWTRTPPTEPGLYFWCGGPGHLVSCLEVESRSLRLVATEHGTDLIQAVGEIGGLWQPCAVPAPPAPQEREGEDD